MCFNIFNVCCIITANGEPIVRACPLESSCKNVTETSAICLQEEESGCIRKYASMCHLLIASCRQNKTMKDYSDIYCSMETFLCEESPTYERWTLFYGHEKD